MFGNLLLVHERYGDPQQTAVRDQTNELAMKKEKGACELACGLKLQKRKKLPEAAREESAAEKCTKKRQQGGGSIAAGNQLEVPFLRRDGLKLQRSQASLRTQLQLGNKQRARPARSREMLEEARRRIEHC